MQKLISKYGLAAHLALLAVAPLFLFPYCGQDSVADVLMWLSAFVAAWTIMEPSRRSDEMLHDARDRVFFSVLKDPLFWFSLVMVALAAIRWYNSGTAMIYDAESGVWRMSTPALPFMPSGITDSGRLPFATAIAFLVIVQACRHALGKSARIGFILLSATLAGLAAIIACVVGACGNERVLALEQCALRESSFVGIAFGLYFITSMVTLTSVFEQGWKTSVSLLIPGVGGSALGLFLFAPPPEISVVLVAALVVLALSVVYAMLSVGGTVAPKGLVMLLISLCLPVLLVMWAVTPSVRDPRIAAFMEWNIFPENFETLRASLSVIANKVWGEHPWLGTGVGTFAMDIRFNATEMDWAMLPVGQVGALNGWRQLLAERGITGALFFIAPIGFLFWTYAVRAFYAFRRNFAEHPRGGPFFSLHPACWTGPAVIVAVTVCGFIDYSFLSSETILAIGAIIATSGSSFPIPRKVTTE